MKNLLTTILLMLLLMTASYAQTTTSKDLEVEYDKFKDSTTVTLKLPIMEGLLLVLIDSFSGKKRLSMPDNVLTTFMSVSDQKQFYISHSWIILADDERIRLGDGLYTGGTTASSRATEVILYPVSQENLKKIANAKKVEMQLGSKEFALTESQITSFKEFYKQLTP